MGEVRTQALTNARLRLRSAEILNGIWPNTLAYTHIYTYSHTRVDASAKLNTNSAETCAQASTTCVCSDDSTHNLFN